VLPACDSRSPGESRTLIPRLAASNPCRSETVVWEIYRDRVNPVKLCQTRVVNRTCRLPRELAGSTTQGEVLDHELDHGHKNGPKTCPISWPQAHQNLVITRQTGNGETRTRTGDTTIFRVEPIGSETGRFAGPSLERPRQRYRWFPGDSWGFGPGGGLPQPKPRAARGETRNRTEDTTIFSVRPQSRKLAGLQEL
jgi:hypothetical protein